MRQSRTAAGSPASSSHYHETSAAVIDAKYKSERPDGFPNADLYQMLAYCTVLGLGEGHLIYAKGNEPTSLHTVQRAGVTIRCHALDLGLEPTALLEQVDDLAAAVTTTAKVCRWLVRPAHRGRDGIQEN